MQNNFNFIAPFYDPLARLIFGAAIKRSQLWLVDFIPANASVLVIGGGTGWILDAILQQKEPCRILYLEASAKMLKISQKRYQKLAKKSSFQVEFRLGTETALRPEETFDVIFTGFLLDLFQPAPLQQLMRRLYLHLKPEGYWLVADFAPENAIRIWQKSLLKIMVLFFKLTANLQASHLPDLNTALGQLPLLLKQKHQFYHNLIFAAVYRNATFPTRKTPKSGP